MASEILDTFKAKDIGDRLRDEPVGYEQTLKMIRILGHYKVLLPIDFAGDGPSKWHVPYDTIDRAVAGVEAIFAPRVRPREPVDSTARADFRYYGVHAVYRNSRGIKTHRFEMELRVTRTLDGKPTENDVVEERGYLDITIDN